MSEAPEKLFCWNFQTKEGGWEKGWGGYSRQSKLRPLDDREVKTGALYVRADLIPAMVEAAYRMALEDAAKEAGRYLSTPEDANLAGDIIERVRDITPPDDLVERVKGGTK